MDLLNKYLKGCSLYIMKLTYDLEKREVVLICAQSIGKWIPEKQVKFTDVTGFTEEALEDLSDDTLIDSVMGLHEFRTDIYCLRTEKRELTIHTTKEPESVILQ